MSTSTAQRVKELAEIIRNTAITNTLLSSRHDQLFMLFGERELDPGDSVELTRIICAEEEASRSYQAAVSKLIQLVEGGE